jgi:hypothetical protein
VEHANHPQSPPDHLLVEQAVLGLLLQSNPAHLSLDELIRALATDPDSFPEQDAIRNAVRDLAAVGLIHRHGNFVFPTRAAIAAAELLNI